MAPQQQQQQQPLVRHSIPTRSASQRSARSRLSDSVNIFSDDFALEPLDTNTSSPDLSPIESTESINQPSTSQSRLINASQPPPAAQPAPPRPRNSIAKRRLSDRNGPSGSAYPNRTQSVASQNSLGRNSSVSSRFDIPRAPSPYTGATGPSHPYQMYPQVTRSSSVSTIRAPEEAFVGPNRPEHPYAMYPQNTVPEEEDGIEVIPTSIIQVGFPGMGHVYQQQVGPAADDVGDIIGPDGHTESLPPYSRYPDEPPRKVVMVTDGEALMPSRTASTREVPLSEMSTLNDNAHRSMSDNSTVRPTPSEEIYANDSFREKMRRNGKKRICCGLPLWVIVMITGMVVLAAAIGGVIGAILGTRHSEPPPRHSGYNGSASTTTVTTTSWIDATPLPAGTSVRDVPLGQFQVPSKQLKSDSSNCIADPTMSNTWGCLPPMSLGVTVGNQATSYIDSKTDWIIFDPHPLDANFSYGPQPPDLHGIQYTLKGMLDKDAPNLGPALFFFTEYDKVVIVPESFFTTPQSTTTSPAAAATSPAKRSIPESELMERQYPPPGGGFHRKNRANPGEKPWFCFWNSTVLEFFIYVGQNTSTDASSSSSVQLVTETTTSTSWATETLSTSSSASSVTTTATTTEPTIASAFGQFNPSYTTYSSYPTATSSFSKRNSANQLPIYPRYVKIEEKRKPAGNVAPYCQQMQVLDDGSFNPVPGVQPVTIEEAEPSTVSSSSSSSSTSGSSSKFRKLARQIENQLEELEKRQTAVLDSFCSCEWLSTSST